MSKFIGGVRKLEPVPVPKPTALFSAGANKDRKPDVEREPITCGMCGRLALSENYAGGLRTWVHRYERRDVIAAATGCAISCSVVVEKCERFEAHK